jgi:hypothetical protein
VASGFSRTDVIAIGVGVVVPIWLASAFGLSALWNALLGQVAQP